MVKKIYIGGAAGTSLSVSKIYVGVDGAAKKVTKVYIGDANNLSRLAWTAEIPIPPLEITYDGTYTDEVVTMADGTFRLITLYGTGVHNFSASRPFVCDMWVCGGGGAGAGSRDNDDTGGGGGGYAQNLSALTIDTTGSPLEVTVGAGARGGSAADGGKGGATSVTQDGTEISVANGGFGGTKRGRGGNGGSGGGGKSEGKGMGSTTVPFVTSGMKPFCAGGGGRGSNFKGGGNGGSDGSDGGVSGGEGKGGYFGGGDGIKDDRAGAGTAWGAGGGGGKTGGAGYQGCVMLRIAV